MGSHAELVLCHLGAVGKNAHAGYLVGTQSAYSNRKMHRGPAEDRSARLDGQLDCGSREGAEKEQESETQEDRAMD